MSRPIETPSATSAEGKAAETSSGAMPADVAHAAAPEPSSPDVASVSTSTEIVAAPAPAVGEGAAPAPGKVDKPKLEALIIDALHTVYDPEIPVDIYELGLIYSVEIDDNAKVAITMTLTTPACPVAGSMPGQVEKTVRMIDGVSDVTVDLVWEPTWGPSMMTESARLQLNMY